MLRRYEADMKFGRFFRLNSYFVEDRQMLGDHIRLFLGLVLIEGRWSNVVEEIFPGVNMHAVSSDLIV